MRSLYLWQQDESLSLLQPALERTPRSFQVLSFDFFDTLVARLSPEPSDLFFEVGRRLAAAHGLRHDLSPREFHDVRRVADERARKEAVAAGRPIEIGLLDIYRALGAVVADPEAAAQVEREVELDWCYLNPSTASLLRYARSMGFRTAILSDTYLSAEDLRAILRHNGFDESGIDLVLASSEEGCAKYDGRLFRMAADRLGVQPSEMLHIGDNLESDCRGAARAGVEARHYYRTAALHDEIFRREAGLRPSGRPFAGLHSLRVLANRLCVRGGEPLPAQYRDGAFVLGPVLARFADACVERFARAGVSRVLSLMREGELLGELVRRAATARGIPLTVVDCYTSRRATALAALGEATAEGVHELLRGRPALTLRHALAILGMEDQTKAFSEEELGRDIDTPEMLEAIARLVTRGEVRRLLETRSRTHRELAFAYLGPLAGGEPVVGVLDLGWSGSIQRHLSRIFRLCGRPVKTVGCYLGTTSRAGHVTLDGDLAHAYLDEPWTKRTLLLEIAITACVGSTDGYAREEGGTVAPVLGPFEIDPEERQAKELLRMGVLAFQELWLEWHGRKAQSALTAEVAAEIDAYSQAILHRLIDFPLRAEARRFGGLHHDENYGVSTRRLLCEEGAVQALNAGGAAALGDVRVSYWPEGVLAREAPALSRALSSRFSDLAGLGRLGARASHEGRSLTWREDELPMLEKLAQAYSPEQILSFGSGAPGDAAWLATFLPNAGRNQKTVNVVDVVRGEDVQAPEEIGAGCVRLIGQPTSEEHLRRVRRFLQPGHSVLLLLDRDLTDAESLRILNYLGPFLGRRAVVAACHGERDQLSLTSEMGPFRAVRKWFADVGGKFGYEEAPEIAESQDGARWTALRRVAPAKASTPPQTRVA
jgi:FMN phosphatase YigB (HAD superfamily)